MFFFGRYLLHLPFGLLKMKAIINCKNTVKMGLKNGKIY